MKSLFGFFAFAITFVLAGAPASAQFSNPGQAAGLNAALTKLFGDITAFSSKTTVRLLDKDQKETLMMPATFALLDSKIRTDVDLSQLKSKDLQAEAVAMFKQMGMEKLGVVIRPDRKTTITVYPALKSYVEAPMSKEEADSAGKDYKVSSTKLGMETLEGHPCEKSKVIVTDDKGKKQEATVWRATDQKNFPIQIQLHQGDGVVFMNFREVVIARPDAKAFEAPAGYTRYASNEKLMEAAAMKMMGK